MAQDGNGIRYPRSTENPRFRNLNMANEERRNRQMRNNARGEGDILRELREAPLRVVPKWDDEDFEKQSYGKGASKKKFSSFGRNPRMAKDENGNRFQRSTENPP